MPKDETIPLLVNLNFETQIHSLEFVLLNNEHFICNISFRCLLMGIGHEGGENKGGGHEGGGHAD